MAYRGMGQSGEVETEVSGWLRGLDVTGSDMPGYSTIIPYGQKEGAMMGGTPTAAQLGIGGSGVSAWIQQNKSTVYLVSGALVLMAMFGGGRRR